MTYIVIKYLNNIFKKILIKHFSEGKYLRQNIRYELKVGKKKLEIFNIHTKLIDNEEALENYTDFTINEMRRYMNNIHQSNTIRHMEFCFQEKAVMP